MVSLGEVASLRLKSLIFSNIFACVVEIPVLLFRVEVHVFSQMRWLSLVVFVVGSVTGSGFSEFVSWIREREAEGRDSDANLLPKLDWDAEIVKSDESRTEAIQIGQVINRSRQSTIFSIVGRSNLVMKYQADCFASLPFHPILRDAYFLNLLDEESVTPRVYYISPGSPFPMAKSRKTDFTMTTDQRARCANAASVRFMIMERADYDMYELGGVEGIDFFRAMRIVAVLMSVLERVHGKNVVHGDIHPGNVVMLNRDGPSLGLIDFGMAFLDVEMINKPEIKSASLSQVHCLHSLWELQGYRSAKRDDVFRALMVGVFLVEGRAFHKRCKSLESRPAEMLDLKEDSLIFDLSTLSPLGAHVMLAWKSVLTRVRSLGIKDPINYAQLADDLQTLGQIKS